MSLVVSAPESMVKVRVVTVKDLLEETLKALHIAGVLHVEESRELQAIDRATIEDQATQVRQSLANVDSLLSYIPEGEKATLTEDIVFAYIRPLGEINSQVTALYATLTKLQRKIDGLSKAVGQAERLNKYLQALVEKTNARLEDLSFSGNYLFARVFVFPNELWETFYGKVKQYLLGSITASVEDEVVFWAIARVEHQHAIESSVENLGGKVLDISTEDLILRDFLTVLDTRISDYEESLAKLNQEARSTTQENLEQIVLWKEVLLAEKERLSVLEKACEAKYVTLIEGWVPEIEAESALSEVKDSIDYVSFDVRKPAPTEEPPIKLNNLRPLRPFEVIINLLGLPNYREWDPTPIVGYSFAFFFGIMLCDAIYGLGLILATKFLLKVFVDEPESDNFKLFQRLLYTSGGVAVIFGLVTGTYLGNIPEFFGIRGDSIALVRVIRDQFVNPVSFLVLALIIGLVHVNLAHLITLVRGIKDRNWGIVLNKIALFTFESCSIPYFLHSLLHIDLLLLSEGTYSILIYVTIASVLLIIVSWLLQRGGLGAIFWIFDLTGILGDIMSYARLAGVGLATFYLASSFNMVASLLGELISSAIPLVGGVIGTAFAIVLMLILHTLNMALSALAAFVHSLRLCFVEFLTKFHQGGGEKYSPFRLKMGKPVITTKIT